MRCCPHCGWTAEDEAVCSRCFSEMQPAGSSIPHPPQAAGADVDEWTTIARFGNAAEAGYFANELEYALGFEPRLEFEDNFDVIAHHWRSAYVLAVRSDEAEAARQQLQQILNGESLPRSEEPFPAVGSGFVSTGRWEGSPLPHGRPAGTARIEGGPSASNIHWAPIVLTLAAGSLVLWGGKKVAMHRRPEAPPDAQREPIWDALADDATPWIQRRHGERGLRELRVDAASGRATIREDLDGDGKFEREEQFVTPRH